MIPAGLFVCLADRVEMTEVRRTGEHRAGSPKVREWQRSIYIVGRLLGARAGEICLRGERGLMTDCWENLGAAIPSFVFGFGFSLFNFT